MASSRFLVCAWILCRCAALYRSTRQHVRRGFTQTETTLRPTTVLSRRSSRERRPPVYELRFADRSVRYRKATTLFPLAFG